MIIKISGGIGNQMFQYAFKKSLDALGGKNYLDLSYFDGENIHNGYELKKVFRIQDEETPLSIKSFADKHKILLRIFYKLNIRMFKTKNSLNEILLDYYPEWNRLCGENYYLDGYWQSEKYFSGIKEEIINIFTFPEFTDDKNQALMGLIAGKNSVSLHVRRGDFLGASKFECLGRTDYYTKAIEIMNSKIKNPVYVVLSDDIDWCRENLKLENAVFVDWNTGENSYRDMQIMSCCSHNIIANSSFSWWGAWLNSNSNKIVIAPDHFYVGDQRNETALIPDSWMKISYGNK